MPLHVSQAINLLALALSTGDESKIIDAMINASFVTGIGDAPTLIQMTQPQQMAA